MQFFVCQQIQLFVYSVLCGIIIGILNEPFRFLRYAGFNSKTEVFIQDIIFMSANAIITFFFTLCFNKGDVRFFILFGELAGFLLFRYSIGMLTGYVFGFIFFVIKKISVAVKSFFSFILSKLYKTIRFILSRLPLFNKVKKFSCHRGKLYCIIIKSTNFFRR
ncbi:MAG: spore cortex biosynthesis protein YabQ [Clostridia bacterium]|nr:spore cortex biosynthesis protein YabQ [Clostridia bacterium]